MFYHQQFWTNAILRFFFPGLTCLQSISTHTPRFSLIQQWQIAILTVCKPLRPVFDLCPLVCLAVAAVTGLEGTKVAGDGLRGGAQFSARRLPGWSWSRSYRQGGLSHQMGLGEGYLGKNGTQRDLEANVDLKSVSWSWKLDRGYLNDCLSHKSPDVDMKLRLVIILPLKGSKFGLDITIQRH